MALDSYRAAAELLSRSHRVVALTGAGISTPSGIQDFRSPGTGLWNQVDPERVASIQGFMRDPSAFFEWFCGTALQMYAAEPNAAHHALAELERRGTLRAVATQNIDGLHHKAGSRRVLELHGSPRTATCTRCHDQVETQPLLEQFTRDHQVPRCTRCGGVLKPNVVFFGEMLPGDVLVEARQEIAICDLLLVVGTSLTVSPAAELPWQAVQSRTPIVLCNREGTWADPYAAFVFREDVAQSVPALLGG
jgi:NAD-dependent deacetylase